MAKEVTFLIKAKNLVGRGVRQSLNTFRKMGRGVSVISGAIGAAMRAGIAAGALGVAAAVGVMKKALDKSFEFERYETQFKVLFGSLDKAKKRMEEIKKFSSETQFEIGDVSKASRLLHLFSGGLLGASDSLRLIGDAAAGVGQPIQDVSMWVGRAYAAIKAGQPFGEATMRLLEMGIVSGEAKAKLEDLTKSGGSSSEMWSTLQAELERFSGAQKEASSTGEGLISVLKDNLTQTLGAVGDKFSDLAKGHIAKAIDWLQRFREDGGIDEWADRSTTAIDKVGAAFNKIQDLAGQVQEKVAQFQSDRQAKDLARQVVENQIRQETGGGLAFHARSAKIDLPGTKEREDFLFQFNKFKESMDTVRQQEKEEGAEKQAAERIAAGEKDHAAWIARQKDMVSQSVKVENERLALKKRVDAEMEKSDADRAEAAKALEAERVKAAQTEIEKLMQTDRHAVAAMAEARKKGLDDLTAGDKADPGKRAEGLLKFVKTEAESLREDEERRRERVKTGRSRLREQVEEFRIQGLSQQDQLTARREREAQLGRAIRAEQDPEKRLDLQNKLLAEMGKIRGLEGGTSPEQEEKKRIRVMSIGLGEAFDRSRRQDEDSINARANKGKRSPEEDIAQNTNETVKILRQIVKKGGMR